jgi:cobyric acid synthase
MNRKKILIGLGIALAVILACGGMAMLGGNLFDMIRAHLGM